MEQLLLDMSSIVLTQEHIFFINQFYVINVMTSLCTVFWAVSGNGYNRYKKEFQKEPARTYFTESWPAIEYIFMLLLTNIVDGRVLCVLKAEDDLL